MASFVDLLCEFKDFGDVFAGKAGSHNNWRKWYEIEVIFEVVEDFVGLFVLEVGLGDDENNALAGLYDFAGKRLVELGMWLGTIDEEAANVGFFDCGKAAECGEFFDANFAFARLAEACCIEQLDSLTFVLELCAVNVAGGATEVCDDSLLLLCKRVKE